MRLANLVPEWPGLYIAVLAFLAAAVSLFKVERPPVKAGLILLFGFLMYGEVSVIDKAQKEENRTRTAETQSFNQLKDASTTLLSGEANIMNLVANPPKGMTRADVAAAVENKLKVLLEQTKLTGVSNAELRQETTAFAQELRDRESKFRTDFDNIGHNYVRKNDGFDAEHVDTLQRYAKFDYEDEINKNYAPKADALYAALASRENMMGPYKTFARPRSLAFPGDDLSRVATSLEGLAKELPYP